MKKWWGEEHGRRPKRGRIVNRNELAAIFDVTAPTISKWQLLGMPVLRKGARGIPDQFDAADCLWWRIQYVARAISGDIATDLPQRKLRAVTRLKELEVERKASNLIPVAWWIEAMGDAFRPVSEVLARIAPKLAPLVAKEKDLLRCQLIIADAVNEARAEIVAAGERMKSDE